MWLSTTLIFSNHKILKIEELNSQFTDKGIDNLKERKGVLRSQLWNHYLKIRGHKKSPTQWGPRSLSLSPPLTLPFLSFSFSLSIPSVSSHLATLIYIPYILLYKMGFATHVETILKVFNNLYGTGQSKWPPVQHCPAGKSILSIHVPFVNPFSSIIDHVYLCR